MMCCRHGTGDRSWEQSDILAEVQTGDGTVRGSSNYYQIYRIQRRHWIRHGEITGLSKQQTEAMIEEIIARTPGVIERVSGLLPDQFPQQLAESIFDGMRQQCRRLAEK